MASLRNIMNVDDDHVDSHSLKKSKESAPRSSHRPASSASASSYANPADLSIANSSSSSGIAARGHNLNHPPSHGLPSLDLDTASSPSSYGLAHSAASYTQDRRQSNTSTDSMDSPYGQGHGHGHPGGSYSGGPMRPFGHGGEPSVKLTPITGRVSRAKKGLAVHTCETCRPPKTFTRAEHLRRHQLSHQPPELSCQVPGCDKVFHRKDLLDRHQQKQQQDGESHSSTEFNGPIIRVQKPQPWPIWSISSRVHASHVPSVQQPAARRNDCPEHIFTRGSHGTRTLGTDGSFGFSYEQRGRQLRSYGFSSALAVSVLQGHRFDLGDLDRQLWCGLLIVWKQLLHATFGGVEGSSHGSHTKCRVDDAAGIFYHPQKPAEPDGGVLLPGYDESLYNGQIPSNAVRSLSPQLAVGPSSETLVTAPAALPADRVINPMVCGRQPDTAFGLLMAQDLMPITLSREARNEIPIYISKYWEKVANSQFALESPVLGCDNFQRWKTVHGIWYYEQPFTSFLGLDNFSPMMLSIPLSAGTERAWEAETADSWASIDFTSTKSKTVGDAMQEHLSPSIIDSMPRFDASLLLAAHALQLPRRQSHTEVEMFQDASCIKPHDMVIPTLFQHSPGGYTYLALHYTPLHWLLSVSGDSWIFNKKVSHPTVFMDHKAKLQKWRRSGNAAAATVFAAKALKIFLNLGPGPLGQNDAPLASQMRSSPNWTDISDFWGVYVCALICWAFGYEGKRNPSKSSRGAAVGWLLTVSELEPGDLQNLAGREESQGVVGLVHDVLERDCLGGRNILYADAVGVLRKLEEVDNWAWV
ncbi:stress responsive a/B barrel domain-containing protein [Purpureocillium lavendulum]|uniref:Stress responsive a/B barrel domain-containing protein n=1 Tax=Purpureocillium lavendulum TaxID=1247861 RepID=A0AB34FXK3_9HYPO|nr:stress responsive a/B barrel domain-containing protein [Purpureocillium lavendulum]